MRLLEHHTFRAMGTTCGVGVTTTLAELPAAHRAIGAAVAEVSACEQALSRFAAESDVSRLNAAGGAWTNVDQRLLDALAAAVEAGDATGGRFDPPVLPALVAAGYESSLDELAPHAAKVSFGCRAAATIEVDHVRGRARLEPSAALDLGGIGRGFSADRALAAMVAAWPAMQGSLVDLGGDLVVSGEPPDGGTWWIAVPDPRVNGGRLCVLCVRAGGVARSKRDWCRFGLAGELHHLIDPAKGEPAVPSPLAVTVVARDAASAATHAAALAITPVMESSRYVAARPYISALIVPAAGPPSMLGDLPAGAPTWAYDAAS